MKRLARPFFNRPTLSVARELLGARLVHQEGKVRVAGIILETEAYIGEADDACHARAGLTGRTAPLYGPPGHAYVYLNYGIHWLFNCVTEAAGCPAAVLVRALRPAEGIGRIRRRRAGRPEAELMNGPGKLTQALGLDRGHNGLDLCDPQARLFLESGDPIPDSRVTTTPRVGLNKVSEPWKSIPWRFVVRS